MYLWLLTGDIISRVLKMLWSKIVQNNTSALRGCSYIYQNVRNCCKETDFSFVTDFPYGARNRKEKWIDLYFQKPEGDKIKARAYLGWNLMRAIRMNKLTKLFYPFGHCDNGLKNCAHCHVLFDPEVYLRLPKMNELEYYYVRYQMHYFPGMSRLACRIKVSPGMDGATIRLPKKYDMDDSQSWEKIEFDTD